MQLKIIKTNLESSTESAKEVLNEALAKIEEVGGTHGIGIILITPDRSIESRMSKSTEARHLLIAGCEYLKAELINDD